MAGLCVEVGLARTSADAVIDALQQSDSEAALAKMGATTQSLRRVQEHLLQEVMLSRRLQDLRQDVVAGVRARMDS